MPPDDRTHRRLTHPMELYRREGLPFNQALIAHLRGWRIEPQEAIRDRSLRFRKDSCHIPLGSVYLPEQALFEGIAFVGSSGSGKSVGINQIKRNRLSH